MYHIECPLLLDTGAAVPLIDHHSYLIIAASRSPPLHPIHTQLQTADGGQMKLFGETTLKLAFDRFHTSQDVVVDDLREWGGIVGIDFLRERGCDDWAHNICINQERQAIYSCTCSPSAICRHSTTMELVVTGIAANKLQYAGGSSALLTPSASLVS